MILQQLSKKVTPPSTASRTRRTAAVFVFGITEMMAAESQRPDLHVMAAELARGNAVTG